MKDNYKMIKILVLTFIVLLNGCNASNLDKFKDLEDEINKSRCILEEEKIGDIESVKKHLKCMTDLDQKIRKKLIEEDLLTNPKTAKLLECMDRPHGEYLKKILETYGWITISKFGKEADHEAWLIVQHANYDPFFQAGCAFVLQKLVDESETNPTNYAYLYDRVAGNLPNLGFKQRYGTQLTLVDNKWELSPYEGNLETIDLLRSQVGLNPLADYIKEIQETYK